MTIEKLDEILENIEDMKKELHVGEAWDRKKCSCKKNKACEYCKVTIALLTMETYFLKEQTLALQIDLTLGNK